ncbi:ABC transporter B family member 11 [Rhynchospora pubera]|uniref:ABC transporter B family member 11 n=1 Tax=Rhynchospora pubera TaxID=906938 RepID=A0AAV8FAB8_9POAL|nr:ABC transporter B family member 11 [Rhynchospora pubera]
MAIKEKKEANGATKDTGTSTSKDNGIITGSEKDTDFNGEKKKKAVELEKKKVPLYKLFTFADGFDVTMMVIGGVAAMANGMAQPMMTFIFGDVINAFGGGTNQNVLHRVTKVILNFVYLGIASGVASFLSVTCWTITGERQAARIRELYLKSVLRQDIGFFDKEMTTGQVVERMSGDTLLVQDSIGEKVGKFLQLITTFFGGFIVAFVRGWLLALVMLACIPPIVVAGAVVSRMISTFSTRSQAKYGEAGNVAEQTIGSIRTVASFNGESQAVRIYNQLIHKAYKSYVQEGTATGFGMGSVFMILFCSYGLAVWYGSKLIVNKGYNGGIIINILMAVMTGAMSLGQATPCITAFAEGQAAAYRMFEAIKRKPDIDALDTTGIVLKDIKGDVELKDVYFSYPARPDHMIFNGFSLRITSGSTMAIVGESGSGKSTVINLVERFYDPQSGQVLIDGVDLKTMKLGWIRSNIGLVSQEPLLFATTIKENIAYGKEDATVEEIKRAIEMANAAKFVDKLPNGIDTMVGERGIQLSGGQKQRIAIARAIIKNPKILLLDEATSALDLESERVVQEALNRIMLERTTIIVAHRLSTVRNANAIAVIHQGKLVEQGSHEELIKNTDGPYSQLIHLQAMHQDKYAPPPPEGDIDLPLHVSPGANSAHISRSPINSQSRSISSLGNSNRHSFNAFAMTHAQDFPETTVAKETEGTDQDPNAAKKNVPMRRLFALNKPEALVLLFGSIAASVHGVIFPIFSIVMSSSIKVFYEPPHQLLKDSRFWASMYVVLAGAAFISIPAEYFLFGVAGGKLIERIRSSTFKSVVHQEINWFDEPKNSSGSITARLSTDAVNVKRLVGDNLALNVQTLATVISGFLIAIIANWKLTLIILVVVPMVGLQGYFQVKFLKGFSANAKVMYEEASQIANDAVSGIRTVASFCMEQKVIETYNKKCDEPMKQGIRTGLVGGLGYGLSFLLFYFSYALCFYAGAKLVHKGEATFTEVFRVFFALVLSTIGVARTSAIGSDTTKAKDSATSILEILDRKSKIDSSSDEGRVLTNVRGEIELQNIVFTYPARPNAPVFRDLSLLIPSGKTVALVGESGSGKSTVIALLERFYDPDSGKVLFDGVELQSLQVRWLRQQVGLVAQEPVLFNDTIRTNIAYGKHGDVTEEEIIAVAKAANAHQFISGLPDGYNTIVGERGIQLSGGQKQRVAIARAILKNPKVLLLDEATSALDAESEHAVQEALDHVMIGRTTVVVAHRLSTIKGADIIAVVKNGTVVEKGRHEELICRRNGAYAALVELSMSAAS